MSVCVSQLQKILPLHVIETAYYAIICDGLVDLIFV